MKPDDRYCRNRARSSAAPDASRHRKFRCEHLVAILTWFGSGNTSAIIVSLLLFGHGLCQAQTATNSHVLVFLNTHQQADTYVNGFPLHSVPGTNQHTTRVSGNPYLVRGTNQIRVLTTDILSNVIAFDNTLESVRLDYFSIDLDTGITLFEAERKARPLDTNGIEEVVTFTNTTYEVNLIGPVTAARTAVIIDSDNHQASQSSFIGVGTNCLTLNFILSNAPLTSLPWLTLAPAPGPADFTAITQVVQAVYSAFTNHSSTALTNLMRLKIGRAATAKGLTFDEEASGRVQFFDRLFAQPITIDPLDVRTVTIKLYPPANLVQILLNGQAPIVVNGPGFRFRQPLFLSNVGGTWTVVD